MNTLSLVALVTSLTSLVFALSAVRSSSPSAIGKQVDARLTEREKQLVAGLSEKFAQIEVDLGGEPSNPTTLEELGQSFARLVFMPSQAFPPKE